MALAKISTLCVQLKDADWKTLEDTQQLTQENKVRNKKIKIINTFKDHLKHLKKELRVKKSLLSSLCFWWGDENSLTSFQSLC